MLTEPSLGTTLASEQLLLDSPLKVLNQDGGRHIGLHELSQLPPIDPTKLKVLVVSSHKDVRTWTSLTDWPVGVCD